MTSPAIKTHESDEPTSSLGEASCGVCQRQISRYTCPSCNLPYCSLNCFRSEVHSRCSESFYRKEIEIGIKSGNLKTEDDRNKMIDLLKRMEDETAVDGDDLFQNSDEENEEDSLAHRFSAVDISSASADDLLRLLSKKERDKFFSALKDPSSGLVQKLLTSEEVGMTGQLPWWEAANDSDQVPPSDSLRDRHGMKPDLMAVPTDLIAQASRGISLLYNICVVFLGYSYVTRHLSMSPLASARNGSQDQHEARRILSQTAPFLIDRKSRGCHGSLTDAVLSFWSRLDAGSIDNRVVLVLLQDVVTLVRPRRITVAECSSGEGDGVNHPSATAIMAISDISSLFGNHMGPSAVAGRRSHIVMKLTFYAAHILSTSPSRLHTFADEINIFSKNLAADAH